MTLVPFDETIAKEMQDPEFAAAYLQDALEESVEEFQRAFLTYLQVTDSMKKVAREVNIPPDLLYDWLTSSGDPSLKQVCALLKAAGMRVRIDALVQAVLN